MVQKTKPNIKLKKHLTIGSISAENDGQFLEKCFIDTGDYDALIDTEDDRSILLGRTGSGKSALLEMVKKREENVIEIFPEELALNYIAHSNILTLLEECGVPLDPYYQLLWKHIFVVELIKKKYQFQDESSVANFIESMKSLFKKDKAKEVALEYLIKWQDKFWLPVEERVKEITTKIEQQLKTSLTASGKISAAVGLIDGEIDAGTRREKLSNLSREEKEEIRDTVKSAVDSIQIQELHRVIKLLADDIFNDRQQKYYLVIDKIDENWVEDKTRYKLIRALIDTIKSFRRVRSVKFLLALRVDLLQTVLDKTRDKLIQEDKYRDYLLQLRWSASDLGELIEARVAYLFQKQYEKKDAGLSDLFPDHVGSSSLMEWFVKRSLMRPRDIIVYINLCLDRAAGGSSISAAIIRDMEVEYSQERLTAVCQEWLRQYPGLDTCIKILKRKREGFTHSDIDKDTIDNLANEVLMLDHLSGDGLVVTSVENYLNKDISRASLLNNLIVVFYAAGVIGIKRDGHESAIWSSKDSPTVSESEVKRSSHFYIHPMFWRALGTNVDKRNI